MQVRFWGTRGSIAKPGPSTVRYGGNTSCVEVRSAAGTLVVLDCGTGAHGLGRALKSAGTPVSGHILITHTHWDHIQGLPFFLPLFIAGNEWDVYAPRGMSESIRDTLAGQMQYTYFPVTLEELGATIRYHDLVEGAFDIGDIRVTARYLNHPALTLGYRLEAAGASLVYATDHEPHSRRLAVAGSGEPEGEDRLHAEFLAGADLVIHDSQYTAAEYAAKVGWGHSTLEYVVGLADRGGVKRLALFHHDPNRDDAAVDALVAGAWRLVGEGGSSLEVFAAREGQVIVLESSRPAGNDTRPVDVAAVAGPPASLSDRTVLVAASDPANVAALSAAIRADAGSPLVAPDGESALRLARSHRPALILVERHLAGGDGLAVCQALREDRTACGTETPVVVVAEREDPADSRAGAAAGVTDWLVKPFSAPYVRTRIRAWLLRRACHWIKAPLPPDEEARIRALRQLAILDTPREVRFDRLTRIAAALFDVPIALVSLVDVDRQWFKSAHGLAARETPRDTAFCAHAILGPDVMVVPDTLLDSRFAHNPLVTGAPRFRFYAGCPLTVAGGRCVGTLCLIDTRPRQLDEHAVGLLRDLAALVEREIEQPPRSPEERGAHTEQYGS